MIHASLPQTLTPEKLAAWIDENKIDQRTHIEKIVLSPEEIGKVEHKIATVTHQLYELDALRKAFINTLKKGTEFDQDKDIYLPQDFTIPPTKGIDALKANQEHYSKLARQGFIEEETRLFGIPYPEDETVVYVNSEGVEFDSYRENMTEEQKIQFNSLFKNPLDE